MLKKLVSLAGMLAFILCIGVSALAADEIKAATVNTIDVIVDDGVVMAAGYKIDGYTYFKLRDIAYVMQQKQCKFSAGYDPDARSIVLQRGASYEPDGLELQPLSFGKRPAQLSDMPVYIDDTRANLEAYVIDGYTYYKLRDLGEALGFGVDFDSEAWMIVITTPKSVKSQPVANKKVDGKITILLDPGHGGTDPGASSLDGKYDENHINLEVALLLREMLEKQGAVVLMTRTDTNTYPTLKERAAMIAANQQVLDFFLCIHHNAGGGRGSEVLVPPSDAGIFKQSKAMAELVLKEFSSLGLANRGTKDGSNIVVLKGTSESAVPGILTEFCFLDTEDIKYIQTSAGKKAEAEALYHAVMQYFSMYAY